MSPAGTGIENVRFDSVKGLSDVVRGEVNLASVPHTPDAAIEEAILRIKNFF